MHKKILLGIFILTFETHLSAGVWPGETWQTASPESQGVDSAKLNQAMSYLASKCGSHGTDQAVVIRNGYMIWKGSDIDNNHNVWSATKSFTSTVLDLLIDDGKCTLDTYAKDYVSSLSSRYSRVRLRHFATMTSGYNGVRHKEESSCQSYTPFEPAPPQFSPGSRFKYCDDAMNQFGNVLTRIANRTMEDLFRDRIANPIGMNDDKWDWADWGTVDGLVVNGGAGNKGKGIHISARELARFGLLFLNRGNWSGRQLISSSWVDQATLPQVPSSIPGSDGRYCYNWWRLSGAPVPTYMASGHNNNKCIVIRDWDMVIVRLGKDGNISDSIYATFLDKVEDALTLSGESPAAQAAAGEAVWPGRTWVTRAPTEVGMVPEKLAALADYAGGRGCVVRHGYMIYSWGSQSKRDYVCSAEKPWYAHFLWKALEDGKIPSLDQKVNLWEPRLNNINADLGYKDRNITWRHLANQTSCYGVRDNPGDAFKRLVQAVTDTRVSIVNGKWHINGAVTYPGAQAEGLLMNVRMVNCTFEDIKRPDFDAEANTDEFITKIPDYVAHGVRAFTLNLQGGMPGYEGAVNSAFNADGTLRESYLKRVRRVIEACDHEGAVVILGCYYQRQDQVLKDEDAIRTGVINAVKWIKTSGFRNVVLEIANEYGHSGFDYRLLKSPEGIAELIRLAKRTGPELMVSASGYGDGRLAEQVARASDFLLIHFNGTPLNAIPGRIAALRQFDKPIVCNEDAKTGEEGVAAAKLSVASGASWGLMLERTNQHFPFTFNGAADDAIVYAKLKELTSPYLQEESPTAGGSMPCVNLSAVPVTAKERKI